MGFFNGIKRYIKDDPASPTPAKRTRFTRRSSSSSTDGINANSNNSLLVESLNNLTSMEFRKKFLSFAAPLLEYRTSNASPDRVDSPAQQNNNETDRQPGNFTISQQRVEELSKKDLQDCFVLIEQTSSADYAAASAGWNPERKKDEMRTENMWYLLVRRRQKPDEAQQDSPLAGFLSYLVDMEGGLPVIYIYEVHLVPEARGCGLGTHLLNLVHGIVASIGVEKSMLTCFTRNKKAEKLYRHLGYVEDEMSPKPVEKKLRGGKKVVKRPDYIILSRARDSGVKRQ